MHRTGPRLPFVDRAAAGDDQRAVAEEIMAARRRPDAPLLAAFACMLHSPEATRAVANLGAYCRYGSRLADDAREAAILSVAAALGAEYERSHHEPLARRAGIGDAAVQALREGRLDASALSPAQSLAARMAREVAVPGDMAESLVAECRAALGDAATVDLVVTAGYYTMLAAVQRVIDITVADDPRPAAGSA